MVIGYLYMWRAFFKAESVLCGIVTELQGLDHNFKRADYS
jgi:hypothetical protein